MWRYLHSPIFSRFDTIPECDRQTHRQTHNDGIYRSSIALRGKNRIKFNTVKAYKIVPIFCATLYTAASS